MTLLKREIPAPPFATIGTESSFMIIKPGRTTAVTVKPITDGYRSVTPYLSINGAAEAIAFYKRAFGAVERSRLVTPTGKFGHAEIRIGDCVLMLVDECGEGQFRSPQSLNGSSIGPYVYVEDVDAQFAQALDAGAKAVKPVQDQFYGDRTGTLEDPFGHVWFLATHKEDLSSEQIKERAEAMFRHGSS